MTRTAANATKLPAPGDAFMRALRLDHGRLSRALREIDLQQARLRAAPESAQPVLVDAMHYLLHYQHAFHHPREDRLFERICARAPRFGREMRALMREHCGGLRQAELLAADLARASLPQLRGRTGARLVGRLERYAAHTRDHIRSEEAVFYAQSERALKASDWAALLAEAAPEDPMGDRDLLARDYPRLAERLHQAVNGVSGRGEALAAGSWPGGAAHRARNAVGDGFDQLLELYGELIHEGLEIARTNFDTLRAVRSPWDLWHVAQPIGARSYGTVARWLTDPPRLAAAVLAEWFGASRPAGGGRAPQRKSR